MAMADHGVEVDRERLTEFCRRHHIRRLSLFGSVLRGDSASDSDVDFLVEFEPGHTPGLFGIAGMESELTQMVGRQADLRTAEDLSRYFREQVVREAELQYAA
jgi:predicted nucleotidyltransferase